MSWAEKRRVRTSGGEVAFVEAGSGPAVVLLHGFPLSSFEWRSFIPQLGPKFRVIAPDLLGAGDSDDPAAPEGLRVRPQAVAVRELLDALEVERYAVVGAGMGGALAQRLAVDDRRVEAMVLLNCPGFDLRIAGATEPADPAQQAWSEHLAAASVRAALDAGMEQREKLGEPEMEEYLRPFAGEPHRRYRDWLFAIDGTGLEDMDAALPDLSCPTLILWGEDQSVYPPETPDRLNEAIMSSTLGLLPGCGHFLTEDAPETIIPLIFEYLRAKYLGHTHGHDDPSGAVFVQLERRPEWVDASEFELDEEETIGEESR